MGDALADAFRSEIPCDAAVARALARLARDHLAELGGSADDSDEDVVLRLRDPRTFGELARLAYEDRGLGPEARDAALEHVFDLLPLPRSEGDVIEVESRAPPRLLELAQRLEETSGLTVLHVMHLVYAVFLDRSLIASAARPTRSALYRSILRQPDASEELRALYAGFHIAAVPEPEALAELRRTLRDREVPEALRRSLASIAAATDGGRAAMARLAQREGLLPADLRETDEPTVLANIPRLPERLAAVGRRFQERNPSR